MLRFVEMEITVWKNGYSDDEGNFVQGPYRGPSNKVVNYVDQYYNVQARMSPAAKKAKSLWDNPKVRAVFVSQIDSSIRKLIGMKSSVFSPDEKRIYQEFGLDGRGQYNSYKYAPKELWNPYIPKVSSWYSLLGTIKACFNPNGYMWDSLYYLDDNSRKELEDILTDTFKQSAETAHGKIIDSLVKRPGAKDWMYDDLQIEIMSK